MLADLKPVRDWLLRRRSGGGCSRHIGLDRIAADRERRHGHRHERGGSRSHRPCDRRRPCKRRRAGSRQAVGRLEIYRLGRRSVESIDGARLEICERSSSGLRKTRSTRPLKRRSPKPRALRRSGRSPTDAFPRHALCRSHRACSRCPLLRVRMRRTVRERRGYAAESPRFARPVPLRARHPMRNLKDLVRAEPARGPRCAP